MVSDVGGFGPSIRIKQTYSRSIVALLRERHVANECSIYRKSTAPLTRLLNRADRNPTGWVTTYPPLPVGLKS